MKSSLLALLTLTAALPGYRYQFPRDHFNHADYQTEWWYYTGNLQTTDGRHFGFELTFFRQAVALPAEVAGAEDATWRPSQIHLAHLALSDLDDRHFYHTERLNRAGPGLAGADFTSHRVWNGNWLVQWRSLAADTQELQAVCDRFSLFLDLTPAKPFVIHGKDGVSVKGPAPGEASHYISFTRLLAKGQLSGQPVSGVAWMDHEFFTSPSAGSLAGWDWFAVQLDNDEELMLYRLRDKSGEPDAYSSGTFVDAKGGTRFLSAADFALSPSGLWQSPDSRARYPIAWEISVPSLGLHLSETTSLASQELFTPRSVSPTYWEGAVNYSGEIHGQAIKGVGYLEMTGYQK